MNNPFEHFRDRTARFRGPLKIRARIVSFFVAAIAVASLAIFFLFPSAIERQARSALASKGESIAAMVAHSATAPLVFDDRAGVGEALEAALRNADVSHIEIIGPETLGVMLFSPEGGPSTSAATGPHLDWESSEELYSHEASVVLDGEVIGTVHVDLSTAAVRSQVAQARALVAVIALVTLLLGTLVAVGIGSRMIAPLAGVAAAAERIAAGDLESRAHAPADDEVGQLAGSLNRMVDQVRATQERLTHAQRMESVGKLAGGIAHDFNNLLTTIMASTDLMLFDLPEGHPCREEVFEIREAGTRAAALTKRLLTFSRRQVTQPKVLDLNEVITGVEKMLTRLIGDGLTFETSLDPALVPIHADPGNLEQVIMNLAVNARDAMPDGGTLSLVTRTTEVEDTVVLAMGEPLSAGRYATLSVSDSGIGMDAATVEHAFEPFFTRKGPSHGTGLGLSTVYGIVTQAGGRIEVESTVGVGTTFTLYFPESEGVPQSVVARSADEVPLATGTGRILLVEDQDDVRRLTQKMLERCGYTVLPASGGAAALEIMLHGKEKVDVVLTDVIMPGMNGSELAEAIRQIRPQLPVIFMSGYTDDQLEGHRVLREDVVLIEKPFTAERLATQLHTVLAESDRSRPLAVGA